MGYKTAITLSILLQPLENPAYDPNMYQNFVPQDNVQQYVSSYAGHPFGPASGPGGIDPYSIHGPTGYSMAPGLAGPYGGIPYGPGFPGGPGAFTVQSGYEGFLVPSVLPPPPPPPFAGAVGLLQNLLPLPRSLMSLIMRSGSYIFNSLAVVLLGGAVTTAFCTLTPLCTITFAALPLLGLRDTATALQKTLGQEITTDRVARAAEFVGTALVKYQTLQAEQEKEKAKEKSIQKIAATKVETETGADKMAKQEN